MGPGRPAELVGGSVREVEDDDLEKTGRGERPHRVDGGGEGVGAGLPAQPEEAREVDPGSGGGGGIEAVGGIDEGGEGSSSGACARGGRRARPVRPEEAGPCTSESCPRGNPPPSRASTVPIPVGRGKWRRSSPRRGGPSRCSRRVRSSSSRAALVAGAVADAVMFRFFFAHPGAKTARCQARLSLQCSTQCPFPTSSSEQATGAPPASAYVPPRYPLKEMQCPGPGSSCSSLSSGAPAP